MRERNVGKRGRESLEGVRGGIKLRRRRGGCDDVQEKGEGGIGRKCLSNLYSRCNIPV